MTSNMSEFHSVEEWNLELTKVLIPNDVILSFYILLGLIGNSVVLYVYKFKFTGKIGDRYFVPYLAMTDTFACIVTSTMAIAGNMMQVSFENTYLCKVWWYFCAIATFLSSYTLLIIAVQRYLKVVKPDGKQMNLKINRMALISALIFSVLCAAPTLVLYGSVPFPNADGTLVGSRCCKIKDKYQIVSIVYGTIVGILFMLIISSLIGLYAQVGRTIFEHMQKHKKLSKVDDKISTSSSTKMTIEDKTSRDTKENKSETNNYTKTANRHGLIEKTPVDQHEKINKRILYKFSLMFILITVIYLICYVPIVLIMLVEAIIPTFWDDLSNTSRAVLKFIYQMFIINNIVNPFVYAFMDTKFQAELKKLCGCCTNE